MWRILLAEDQAIVRQGLKMMLEQDKNLQVVAEADNGQEAVALLERNMIDLVIMDIRMPVMNGIEALSIIKKNWPKVKILMLTTFNDDEYAVQSLKEGANGFLLKTSDSEQLINAVHSCLNGGILLHEEVATKVMPRLLSNTTNEPRKVDESLTTRELMIIKLIGEGKTNKEISSELHLSIGTVKNHITQILGKLNLRDRTQIAIYALKHDL